MISKECLYHIVRVQDLDSQIPSNKSVPIVREYSEAFHNDLPGIPPEWEIDFGIDFLPDTNPISIPPYRVASTEVKEFKSQLKDLLEKGFIRPSISPWGDLILFVKKNDGSLRMFIHYLQLNGNWDKHLPLLEFSYNNSYHLSISMAPCEALYGMKCRSPIGWFELGDSSLLGLDLIYKTLEKVHIIRNSLKIAYSRQKSYVDHRRRNL